MFRCLGHDSPEHSTGSRAWELVCIGERITGLRPRPPGAQLGQRQIGRERPPAVPDGAPVLTGVLRQTGGVAGYSTRAGRAVPVADQNPGLDQPVEEVLLGARSGSCGADLAAEPGAGRLIPAAPDRLLRLSPSWPRRGGAVRWDGGTQAELTFHIVAGLPDTEVVVPDLRPDLVLPGQGRDQVDMIRGVPDRYPADGEVVPGRGEAGPIHDGGGDLRPFRIG